MLLNFLPLLKFYQEKIASTYYLLLLERFSHKSHIKYSSAWSGTNLIGIVLNDSLKNKKRYSLLVDGASLKNKKRYSLLVDGASEIKHSPFLATYKETCTCVLLC